MTYDCDPRITPAPWHRQCRVRKVAGGGYAERLVYLPRELARVGQPLRIWMGQSWDPEWVVEYVYGEEPAGPPEQAEQVGGNGGRGCEQEQADGPAANLNSLGTPGARMEPGSSLNPAIAARICLAQELTMNHDPLDPGLGPEMPDLPDLPTARDAQQPAAAIGDKFTHDTAFKLAFIGLGQGGSRIAESFYKLGYGRVCVLNTTHQDLDEIDPAIPRLDLQTGGAGKDTAYAAASIANRQAEVWELLQRAWGGQVDYAIVCVGLGGGTGTGTAPTVIEVAAKYMTSIQREPRVGCIVALPSISEGGQQLVARNVVTGFRAIAALKPSPLLVIDNARINTLYKPSMTQFYELCNRQTSVLLHQFNRLAAQRSRYYKSLDNTELRLIFDSGVITMGASKIVDYHTSAGVSKAIREQLESTILAQVDMTRAKMAACVFVVDPKLLATMPVERFEEGFDAVGRLIAPGVGTVFRGVFEAVGDTNDVRCYTILADMPPPMSRLEELGRRGSLLTGTSNMADYLGV